MNTSFLIFILLPIAFSFADGTNRTIDDALGDVVTGLQVEYLPLNSPNNTGEPFWKHEDQCDGCAILPDRTKAYDETWTATTYFPVIEYMSIGLRFNGTAIYIYLILSNYPENTSLVSRTVCNFRIDGNIVGGFRHETDGTLNYEFNTLAYRNESIGEGEHVVLIETTGNESSYVAFDYAIYTFNDSSHSSALSGGAVTGIVLGILSVLTAAACGAFLFYRRRHPRRPLNNDKNNNTTEVTPFSVFDRSSASMNITPISLPVQQEVIGSGERLSRGKSLEGRVAALQTQMQRLEEQQSGGSSQGPRTPGLLSPSDYDESVIHHPIRRENAEAPPRYTEYHPYDPSG
ncbi:hypothetical protein IW261DRAFT_1572504 [Armillaria novae-zelandiae]|uniref:Uncharacterized protein n=1 Tax=Armillaria novae-zelandiae TaxID=153914 RepID=A0AA39U9Y0_9AGAR|nr:hypothetical protein IW261DRAFT_1572504 [Armillaria novae-zelandiae]